MIRTNFRVKQSGWPRSPPATKRSIPPNEPRSKARENKWNTTCEPTATGSPLPSAYVNFRTGNPIQNYVCMFPSYQNQPASVRVAHLRHTTTQQKKHFMYVTSRWENKCQDPIAYPIFLCVLFSRVWCLTYPARWSHYISYMPVFGHSSLL